MSWKYIDKVGVELEGGYDKPRNDLHADASLNAGEFYESIAVGEVISKPIDNLDKVLEFIEQNWPTEVNVKSGFHIHTSFKNINYYSICMSPSFYQQFITVMEKWGKDYHCQNEHFWNRLTGKNKYCKNMFIPEIQIAYKEKGENREDRRTHLNYCYGLHKTIENRLLPAFKNYKTAQNALKVYLDFIENFIESNPIKHGIIFSEKIAEINEGEVKKIKTKPYNFLLNKNSKTILKGKKQLSKVIEDECDYPAPTCYISPFEKIATNSIDSILLKRIK